MKTILTFSFALLVISGFAQLSPCYDQQPIGGDNFQVMQKDFGDTITFNEYGTGTVITNQYYASGALFSGLPNGMYCDIYDYTGTYGPICKSSSWYDIIKLRFVNPIDSNINVPIQTFGYENPIDSEVDYIVTNFYDENDELVFTYTSTSPEIVNIDLGDEVAAYVTFDDEQSTAYVIDNIWFEPAGKISSVQETVVQEIQIAPNPFTGSTILSFPGELTGARLQLFDIRGREVLNVEGISGNQYELFRGNLGSGVYCFKLIENGMIKYSGNVKVN